MTVAEMLWLFVLLAAVGAGCFYGGWRAAAVYLGAAKAVSDIAGKAVEQANNFGTGMDKVATELASCRAAVEASTEATKRYMQSQEANYARVEGATATLVTAFERATGQAVPRRAPGRQVGEAAPE